VLFFFEKWVFGMLNIKLFIREFWARQMNNDNNMEALRLRGALERLSLGYEVDEQTKSEVQNLLRKDAQYDLYVGEVKYWSSLLLGLAVFSMGCWAFFQKETIWWLGIFSFIATYLIIPDNLKIFVENAVKFILIGAGILWGIANLDEILPTSLAILIGSIIIAVAIYAKK
jgi:hypothetical protein